MFGLVACYWTLPSQTAWTMYIWHLTSLPAPTLSTHKISFKDSTHTDPLSAFSFRMKCMFLLLPTEALHRFEYHYAAQDKPCPPPHSHFPAPQPPPLVCPSRAPQTQPGTSAAAAGKWYNVRCLARQGSRIRQKESIKESL